MYPTHIHHELEHAAKGTLYAAWDGVELPISAHQLAQHLNINPLELNQHDLRTLAAELTPNNHSDKVYGCIEFDSLAPNASAVIAVAPNLDTHRQQQVIAHELGHYVLKHQVKYERTLFLDGEGIDDYYTNPSAQQDNAEHEARYFAAALLIPRNTLNAVVNQGLATNLENLANYFGVSIPMMRYRLKACGIVS